jgi:hypothetical protein
MSRRSDDKRRASRQPSASVPASSISTDYRGTPSQAEGDRATVDEDLCEKDQTSPQSSAECAAQTGYKDQPNPTSTPSQAEGERDASDMPKNAQTCSPSQPEEQGGEDSGR